VIVFQCPCGTDATSRSPRKPLRTTRKHGDPAEPAIKRYVIIGFDNAEKAKAWYDSADMKQLNAYNEQHTKGRAFMVDAVTP
jgi:uncharacterized protein (DUF1330 family)